MRYLVTKYADLYPEDLGNNPEFLDVIAIYGMNVIAGEPGKKLVSRTL